MCDMVPHAPLSQPAQQDGDANNNATGEPASLGTAAAAALALVQAMRRLSMTHTDEWRAIHQLFCQLPQVQGNFGGVSRPWGAYGVARGLFDSCTWRQIYATLACV